MILTSKERVDIIVAAAEEVKAEDIQTVELIGKTLIADYFVIATGRTNVQARAIADRILERCRESGYKKVQDEGYREAQWIVLDYGDVIVHVMQPEQREYYSIEDLWKNFVRE